MRTLLKKIKILFLLSCCISIFVSSCKSKSVVVNASKKASIKPAAKVIEGYNNNKYSFSTLYIKADARFTSDKLNQKVSVEIKLKKDEQLLVSIRFLGITMAKALITPTKVSYYEKLNSTYYDGDFTALSEFLGTDLNFEKVQNLLLGRAIDDLNPEKYTLATENDYYKLTEEPTSNIQKTFYLDAATHLLNKQEISQASQGRKIEVVCSDRKEFTQIVLPMILNIKSIQQKGKAEIYVEYNSASFNEELTFPYSVPSDYKRITIK